MGISTRILQELEMIKVSAQSLTQQCSLSGSYYDYDSQVLIKPPGEMALLVITAMQPLHLLPILTHFRKALLVSACVYTFGLKCKSSLSFYSSIDLLQFNIR